MDKEDKVQNATSIKNNDIRFMEANDRALGEYKKKRIEISLDDVAAMANEKANLDCKRKQAR